MNPVRPTLRCLRDDLSLPIPPIDRLLDEVDHPVLNKAREQFADPGIPHERIAAVDDQVLFKVKIRRWRAAVWPEATLSWMVAAGVRESGSADDFYAALAAAGRTARARYNIAHRAALTTDTHTLHLLPNADDRTRHQLEAAVRFVRHLESLIPELVRRSLCDGSEHAADLDTFGVGVQVRADDGHETYVAIRIVGSVPANLTKIILDVVPGCDQSGWYPEAALPNRFLRAGEQAWSNIMDIAAAAKLLDDGE